MYNELAAANLSEGIFLVDSSDKVVFTNAILNDLLRLGGIQLINRSHWYTFRKIAELSTDAQGAEDQLDQAYRMLDQCPTVFLHTRNSPGSRLQIRLAPNRASSWNGWVGMVRDVTSEWREVTKQSEYLTVILRTLRTKQAEIKGLMDTLLNSHHYWDEQQRSDFLKNIDKNVTKIDQILEYGQQTLNLHLGGIRLVQRPINLKPRMQQALSSMAIRMSGRIIEANLPDDLPEIEVDAARFDQIFQYLLANAIASSPPEGKIRVAAHYDAGKLVISITDQGQGLSDTQLTQILDAPTGANLGDRGELVEANLGLYIARELTRAHGGHLWAESTHGVGTTIYCALPSARRAGLNLVQTPKSVTHIGKPARRTPRFKALVVDDDPEMVKLMRAVLERNGYQVLEARDGRVAVDMVANKKPDVVLLDMYLPDANGIEIGARLREFSSVPIIMISVNHQPENIAMALDVGIDDYLVKPAEWPELLARVRANIRRTASIKVRRNVDVYQFDALRIDFNKHSVAFLGTEIHLSAKEYKFLALLASNAGHVLAYDEILREVWGPEYGEERQYLWVISSRLRKKLGDSRADPKYILTKEGLGYYMPAPNPDDSALSDLENAGR
jgi:two-component system KDP operon response regulator KdpE